MVCDGRAEDEDPFPKRPVAVRAVRAAEEVILSAKTKPDAGAQLADFILEQEELLAAIDDPEAEVLIPGDFWAELVKRALAMRKAP